MFAYPLVCAAEARCGRPARGARRGAARTGRRRRGRAPPLRATAGAGGARALAARRRRRGRCEARLERRRGRPGAAARRRPPARGGELRRRRPRDDRPAARVVADLRDRCCACAGIRGRRRVRDARRPARAARSGDLGAHNARFDLAFLDRETERLTGSRVAAPVVDTVALARRLLAGRVPRASLAQLSYFFGTSVQPCHRALPDAQATAEVLIALIGLAQERGARTVAELVALAATRRRRVWDKRQLAFGAPARPGVYLFHDRNGVLLYVGRARDLRARLRSYFRSERQRPAVEAALGAVERIEWRVLGSELEAALEELRLIRELRPP